MESRSQKYSKSSSRWIWRKKRTETDHEVEQVQSKLQEMWMITTTNQYIPNDVMIQILSRLPGKSLLRFRWACKNWFDLITNPSFAKLQHRNHAINNPSLMLGSYNEKPGSLILRSLNCTKLVQDDDHSDEGLFKPHGKIRNGTVVGFCNGLLCIRRYTWDAMYCVYRATFCIWNPCTNEFKESSVEPILEETDFRGCDNLYGFGYDQTIGDYKLIGNTTCRSIDHHYATVVQVYTLGTNSWKRIENYHWFRLQSMTKFIGNAASFYCIGRRKSSSLGSDLDVIVCFDIAKEEYKEISKPWFVDNLSRHTQLIELNGCLCIAQNVSLPSPRVKVYCHNGLNKNEYSWTKLYTIRQPDILRSYGGFQPLGIFNKNNGDEILIHLHSYDDQGLVWYNVKDDSIRETRSLKVCGRVSVVEAYVENLVSLKSGTYMDYEEEEEQQAERVENNQFYKQRRRRRNRNEK